MHKTLNRREYSRCTDIHVRGTHQSKVCDVFDDNHNIQIILIEIEYFFLIFLVKSLFESSFDVIINMTFDSLFLRQSLGNN